MGFFSNLRDALGSPTMVDPVRGTAQVISVSMPPDQSGGAGMCTMSLVITVPGLPSQAVQKANIVKLTKWPMPGAVLPVEADKADLTRFRIIWDEAQTSRDRGAAQAQQVADHMNATASQEPAGGQDTPTTPSGARIFTTVSVNGQPAKPEDIAQFEAMTGMDLNGDGVVPDGASTVAPTVIPLSGDLAQSILHAVVGAGSSRSQTADSDGDDRVSALERLVKLRDSGALTEAEFHAEKRRILGE